MMQLPLNCDWCGPMRSIPPCGKRVGQLHSCSTSLNSFPEPTRYPRGGTDLMGPIVVVTVSSQTASVLSFPPPRPTARIPESAALPRERASVSEMSRRRMNDPARFPEIVRGKDKSQE